jgi:hypothetical protein
MMRIQTKAIGIGEASGALGIAPMAQRCSHSHHWISGAHRKLGAVWRKLVAIPTQPAAGRLPYL